jgi:hypothetical protein
MVRGSNILGVESKPFDAARWDEEAEEVDEVDENGQKRVKLRNNIIRWRYAPDADGQPTSTRQSNARFVKWSDGSVQVCPQSPPFATIPRGFADGGYRQRISHQHVRCIDGQQAWRSRVPSFSTPPCIAI